MLLGGAACCALPLRAGAAACGPPRTPPRLPLFQPLPQAVAKDVSEAELERAKAAAVSSVLMNLESRAVVAEDIGRQVLTYGHRCALIGPSSSSLSVRLALRACSPAPAAALLLVCRPRPSAAG